MLAAALFGTAQFANAALSRRITGLGAARWSYAGATLALLVPLVALEVRVVGEVAFWGVLAGFGGAAGAALLYRATEQGQVSVAVAVSTVTVTVLPVAVAVLLWGETLVPAAQVGLALALVAMVLLTRSGPRRARARTGSRGVPGTAVRTVTARTALPSLLAGCGFALEVVAVSRLPTGAAGVVGGLWTAFAVGTALLLLVHGSTRTGGGVTRWHLAALGTGTVFTAAFGLLHLAASLQGLATTMAMVACYPAVPVLLGVVLLRERPTSAQQAGFAGVALAVLLLQSG